MLTPNEQRDVEQALAVGDALNAHIVSSALKVTARIQFIAHIICALGLARANGIDYKVVQTTLLQMHREMNRTASEQVAALQQKKRPKLSLISTSVKKET